MKLEEEYEDVLQNMEASIIALYRQNPDLIDLEVSAAIEWLSRIYSAEAQGKTSKPRPIRGTSKTVADIVQQICEFHLGRKPLTTPEGELANSTPLTPDIIAACLKHIQNSIEFWNKERGRQGYLDFVRQFIP